MQGQIMGRQMIIKVFPAITCTLALKNLKRLANLSFLITFSCCLSSFIWQTKFEYLLCAKCCGQQWTLRKWSLKRFLVQLRKLFSNIYNVSFLISSVLSSHCVLYFSWLVLTALFELQLFFYFPVVDESRTLTTMSTPPLV